METRAGRDQRGWLDAELGDRVLVCDGAMGTMLHAAGASLDRWLPELNLTQPETVSEVHRAYVEAGADIIETNTFGANSVTMARFGRKADIALVNRRATELARTAATAGGRNVLVAGSVAPAAAPLSPGRLPDIEAHQALIEQALALESAGVDLLMFETFGDLGSARRADLRRPDLQVPIIAQVTFLEDGKTIGGDSPEKVADVLGELGVVAIGANCALGPRGMRPIIEALAQASSLPLSVQPNAGPPSIVRGRFEYRRNEEYFARVANVFVDLGASIVGGCCGTTPKHIEAIVRQLKATRPAFEVPTVDPSARRRRRDADRTATSGLNFADRLRRREFIIAAEVTPPIGDTETALAGASVLSRSGADALIVTPTPGARDAMSAISFGLLLRERLGVDVVLTAATWDKSLLGLQADLLGAHALGLRSVVCTTGVPPPQGDYPDLGRVFEVSSIDLIGTLVGLNHSIEDRQSRARRSTSFVIGARVNPAAADREFELARAFQKLDAGVGFFVTDPVFSLEELERFVDALRTRNAKVPVLIGVTPLRDFEHAEYLHFEVPGVTIPDEVLERMRGAGTHGSEVGREIATELVFRAAEMVQGVVVVPGETRDTDAAELLRGFVGLGGIDEEGLDAKGENAAVDH